jgi:hypothetical protein
VNECQNASYIRTRPIAVKATYAQAGAEIYIFAAQSVLGPIYKPRPRRNAPNRHAAALTMSTPKVLAIPIVRSEKLSETSKGVRATAQQQRYADDVEQPGCGIQAFGEGHQDERKGNVFRIIRVNPHAPKQALVAPVADGDAGGPPGADHPGREEDKKRREQTCLERCDWHMAISPISSSPRTLCARRARVMRRQAEALRLA